MKKPYLELFVGLFLIVGILSLAFMSIKIARNEFFTRGGYEVMAVFSNCSGMKPGAPVTIAGVEIGRVKSIVLEDYEARISLMIEPGVILQKDVIASIKTRGLIGEKYVEITPGASDQKLQAGGTIRETEPAMDIEGLISKYVHGSIAKPAN